MMSPILTSAVRTEAEPAQAKRGEAVSSEPPVVLCIDDDSRTLEILSKILSRLPVRPVTTGHPQEAIEMAQELKPHLLVLDLMLPEMSGWELLDKIRTRAPREDLRVIVLTAKDSGYERLIATNLARVEVFLAKPFDTADLARHVLHQLHLPLGEGWPGTGTGTGPLGTKIF